MMSTRGELVKHDSDATKALVQAVQGSRQRRRNILRILAHKIQQREVFGNTTFRADDCSAVSLKSHKVL